MDYRRRIADALKELASIRGFYGVTVDELAARAGISKRTIYRYFNSKEEIIALVVEDLLLSLEEKVQEALESSNNPVEKITNVIKLIPKSSNLLSPLVLHDLQKHYPHLWEKVEQFRAGKIQQTFENLLANDEQGFFRKVNPRVFTTALISSVRAVVNPAFIMENNLSPEETVESLFSIFLYGVVATR
ncbi:MAG: TetR/AcrR family transcriptional regulator [Armatimonadetes bacterium]|nr:TetR/AcrR family transcriptional regulator [Armatimonadota bacterium]